MSETATSYLATLEREPSELHETAILAALREVGVPEFQPIVEFQMQFGGYIQRYGPTRFRWGILHAQPNEDSYFHPNRIHFEFEDDQYWITCCNCHGSDYWFLDAAGTLYWCGTEEPFASSFLKKIERDAFYWSLTQQFGGYRKLSFQRSPDEIIPLLAARLREGMIRPASDDCSTIYLHRNIYASVSYGTIDAGIVGDRETDLLDDIEYSAEWKVF